jgi:hypothetical protein
MEDLPKIHVAAGWLLTGGGVAMMLINAVNVNSVICLIVGMGLLAFAKYTHA